MVGSFSRLAHSTPIFARPSFCHTCGRATTLVSARSLARMRGHPGTTLPPAHMHVALRRCLRLRSGTRGQGCPSAVVGQHFCARRQCAGQAPPGSSFLRHRALGRSAVLRRHARCSAPSRRPTAAARGQGGRRSHCGSAAPQGGAVPGALPAWPAAAGRSCL